MAWPFAILAYLLGCIPFGLIVAKTKGVDLRAAGSGNIGATNAMRVMGKGAGALTLVGDVLKGSLAAFLAMKFAGHGAALIAAGAAVLGHDFPLFMRFKGGKGVATSFGVLLVVQPVIGLIGVLVWGGGVSIWRYSSLAALVGFALLPVWALVLGNGDKEF